MDDLFAVTAKQSGKVVAVTPKSISVVYEDGSTQAVELGRRFGVASGMTWPHQVETALTAGSTFDKGDVLAFNTNYFAIDRFDPKQVLWKTGTLVKTAILESSDTLEDSSVLSESVAKQMETDITVVRNITVPFNSAIHNLVTIGESVDTESILCMIEDAVTADSQIFDEDSLDTLRLLSANTPKAKQVGTVEKIEVFYNGDIDDLSPSLGELAGRSDRERRKLAKELGRTFTSGRVLEGLRIDGQQLAPNYAVIRVYITGPVSLGIGD